MKIKTKKETNLKLTFGNVYSSGHSSFSNKKSCKSNITKINISFPFADHKENAFLESFIARPRMNTRSFGLIQKTKYKTKKYLIYWILQSFLTSLLLIRNRPYHTGKSLWVKVAIKLNIQI